MGLALEEGLVCDDDALERLLCGLRANSVTTCQTSLRSSDTHNLSLGARRQLTGLALEKCLVFDDDALERLLCGLRSNLRALSLCGNHDHLAKLEEGTLLSLNPRSLPESP